MLLQESYLIFKILSLQNLPFWGINMPPHTHFPDYISCSQLNEHYMASLRIGELPYGNVTHLTLTELNQRHTSVTICLKQHPFISCKRFGIFTGMGNCIDTTCVLIKYFQWNVDTLSQLIYPSYELTLILFKDLVSKVHT